MQITRTWLYRSRVLGTQYSILGYSQYGKVDLPTFHGRTSRPLGDEGFIGRIKRALGQPLEKKNRGQNNGRIIKYCVPRITAGMSLFRVIMASNRSS